MDYRGYYLYDYYCDSGVCNSPKWMKGSPLLGCFIVVSSPFLVKIGAFKLNWYEDQGYVIEMWYICYQEWRIEVQLSSSGVYWTQTRIQAHACGTSMDWKPSKIAFKWLFIAEKS